MLTINEGIMIFIKVKCEATSSVQVSLEGEDLIYLNALLIVINVYISIVFFSLYIYNRNEQTSIKCNFIKHFSFH